MRKITLTMKIEFDLNRPVEWQFHPAALDKGSNFWRSTAVHRDSGLSFVFETVVTRRRRRRRRRTRRRRILRFILKIGECGENCVFSVFFFAEDGDKSGQWDRGRGDGGSICVSLLHTMGALNLLNTGCPEIFEGVNGSLAGLFSSSFCITTEFAQYKIWIENTVQCSQHFYFQFQILSKVLYSQYSAVMEKYIL